TPSPEEWARFWPSLAPAVTACLRKWGALPLVSADLADPDERQRNTMAVLTGRWGLIPGFPWTGGQEIRSAVRRVRKNVGRQHRDAEQNPLRSHELLSGFSRQ